MTGRPRHLGRPGALRRAIPYVALGGADALCVVTEWLVYRTPDFDRIKALLRDPVMIDGRNLYEPAAAWRGWASGTHGIGRGRASADARRHHRCRRVPRLAPDRPVSGRRPRGHRPRQFLTGRAENLAHLAGNPDSGSSSRLSASRSRSTARSTACCTSPRPRARPTIRSSRSRRCKVGSVGTSNALELAPRPRAPGSSSPRPRKSTAIPTVHPQPETYWGHVNSVGARSMYDEAKRFAEATTMAYHRRHGVDTRIVRIFNTYGPRMRPHDGRVVSNFIVQALTGRAADGLRRRPADAVVLLRLRSGRRDLPAVPQRPDRADQYRQSRANSPCWSWRRWCSS